MCALTVAPPSPSSSPDPRGSSSWSARLHVERPPAAHAVSLTFRDLEVNADDVGTVGEALLRCSPEEMLTAVMRHEAGWRISVDAVGSRAHHMLAGRIATALDAMRSLKDAAAALMPSREGMVGPLFRFASVGGGTGLEHRVEAAVLTEQDAKAIEDCLANGMERVCTWDALRRLRCGSESVARRIGADDLRRSGALLSHMPWERVLALPLWLPGGLSEGERWAILAKVFWAMTYRGFSQAASVAGTAVASLEEEKERRTSTEPFPWPLDPVKAVLDHNCWVDTLEAWNALFSVMRTSETRR